MFKKLLGLLIETTWRPLQQLVHYALSIKKAVNFTIANIPNATGWYKFLQQVKSIVKKIITNIIKPPVGLVPNN